MHEKQDVYKSEAHFPFECKFAAHENVDGRSGAKRKGKYI